MKNTIEELNSNTTSKEMEVVSQEISLMIKVDKNYITLIANQIISFDLSPSYISRFINSLEIENNNIEIGGLVRKYDISKLVYECFSHNVNGNKSLFIKDLEIVNTCDTIFQGLDKDENILKENEEKTKILLDKNDHLEMEVVRLQNLNNALLIHIEEIRKKEDSNVETISILRRDIEKINHEKQGKLPIISDEINRNSEYKISIDFLKEKLDEHREMNSEIESLQKENRDLKERFSVSGVRDSFELSNCRPPTQSSQDVDEYQMKYFEDNLQIQSFHHSEDFKLRDTVHKLSELTRSLLIMCLFTMKVLDNSVTIYQVNDKILNDFPFYMNSIFIENESQTSQKYMDPSTITHEYLEDIFQKINSKYVKEKFEKIKEAKINLIDAKQLETEFMFFVSKDIYKQNHISLQRKAFVSKQPSQIKQEFFPSASSYLVSFLRSIFKIKDETVRSLFQEKDIKKDLQNRLHSLKKKGIEQTYRIVENCINCIKNGVVYYHDKEIYSFSNSYLNTISQDKELCVLETIDKHEKLDLLINILKLDHRKINVLELCQLFNKQSFELNRLFTTIVNYLGDLTNLAITECSLTDKQFALICLLVELKQISFLDLSGNRLTDTNIITLSKVLENHRYLKYLDLSKNIITSKGTIKLAEALRSNKTLEKLFIPGNSVDNNGLKSLVDTLVKNNRTLQYLDIAGNSISGEHTSIYRLLKNNNEIRYLNLSSTVYELEGLSMISQALELNEGLKILYLEKCQLNAEKLSALFKRFEKMNLYELHLNYNTFRDKEIKVITNMLEKNRILKVISLRNCGLSILSLIEFVNKVNNSVERIDVRENKFDFEKEVVNLLINSSQNKKFQILINVSDKNHVQSFANCDRFILY